MAKMTVSDSLMDHLTIALVFMCRELAKQEYEGKWAGSLISLLAKKLELGKSNCKQILLAIRALATIAEKEYLNRVFDKNILKILQEIGTGELAKGENQENSVKNLEILIAVSAGINFYDPTVISSTSLSREELVIKLISLLIVMDHGIFQKKGYKYIHETLSVMGSGYKTEIVELLNANSHRILPASKHYRMAILSLLWNKLSQSDEQIS